MSRSLKIALFTLIGAALVSGCAKKAALKQSPPKKNPPSIPVVDGKIDPAAKRTPMDYLAIHSSVKSKLEAKGLSLSDNCLQWVKITKDGKEIGTYLEVSATHCINEDVVNDDDVLLRLPVRQHAQYFTQYRIVEEGSEVELGVFRSTTSDGAVSFTLEALCDVTDGDNRWDHWASVCNVVAEGTRFRKPEPFSWYDESY